MVDKNGMVKVWYQVLTILRKKLSGPIIHKNGISAIKYFHFFFTITYQDKFSQYKHNIINMKRIRKTCPRIDFF